MMGIRVFAVVIAMLGAGVPALPTAEAIIDKYVEASGGMAAWSKVSTMVTKMALLEGTKSFSVVESRKAPGKVRREQIEKGGQGSIVQGVQGSTAWYQQPGKDPVAYQDEQGDDLVVSANFAWHAWKSLFKNPQLVRTEKFGGSDVYVVRLEPAKPPAVVIASPIREQDAWRFIEGYFDVKTGLLVQTVESTIYQGELDELGDERDRSERIVTTTFADYRSVADGIRVPFKFKSVEESNLTKLLGRDITREYTIESVSINVPLDDGLFSLSKSSIPAEKTRPAGTTLTGTPSAEEIFTRFTMLVTSGKAITNFHCKTWREDYDGVSKDEGLFIFANGKLKVETETSSPWMMLRRSFNGKTAWVQSGTPRDYSSPRKEITLTELDQDIQNSSMAAMRIVIFGSRMFAGAKVLGKIDLRGTDVYSLELTIPGGGKATAFFDAEKGCLRQIDIAEVVNGVAKIERIMYQDYRPVGPYQIPWLIQFFRFDPALYPKGSEDVRATVFLQSVSVNFAFDESKLDP